MKHKQVKSLTIKIPSSILDTVSIPLPTAKNILTSSIGDTLMLTYWLDFPIVSKKQCIWLGDIKQIIKSVLPKAIISELQPERLIEDSGLVYSLKTLSDAWKQCLGKDITVSMPNYTLAITDGKPNWNLQRSLYRYGMRLYYYDCLSMEYLKVASFHFNKQFKVIQSQREKIAISVFDRLTNDILENPNNFKQKLSPEEYRLAKQKQSLHLQHGNRIIRDANIEKVLSNLVHKKNGEVNITATALASGISTKTVRTILSSVPTNGLEPKP